MTFDNQQQKDLVLGSIGVMRLVYSMMEENGSKEAPQKLLELKHAATDASFALAGIPEPQNVCPWCAGTDQVAETRHLSAPQGREWFLTMECENCGNGWQRRYEYVDDFTPAALHRNFPEHKGDALDS